MAKHLKQDCWAWVPSVSVKLDRVQGSNPFTLFCSTVFYCIYRP